MHSALIPYFCFEDEEDGEFYPRGEHEFTYEEWKKAYALFWTLTYDNDEERDDDYSRLWWDGRWTLCDAGPWDELLNISEDVLVRSASKDEDIVKAAVLYKAEALLQMGEFEQSWQFFIGYVRSLDISARLRFLSQPGHNYLYCIYLVDEGDFVDMNPNFRPQLTSGQREHIMSERHAALASELINLVPLKYSRPHLSWEGVSYFFGKQMRTEIQRLNNLPLAEQE